jgi:hypothetical protein
MRQAQPRRAGLEELKILKGPEHSLGVSAWKRCISFRLEKSGNLEGFGSRRVTQSTSDDQGK